MLNQFSRTQLLIGAEAINKLTESRVAVFGIGGVGGYVCEALVRSGVGHFDLSTMTRSVLQILTARYLLHGKLSANTKQKSWQSVCRK